MMKTHVFVLLLLLSTSGALSLSSEDLALSLLVLLVFRPSLLSALPFPSNPLDPNYVAEEKKGRTQLVKLDDSANLVEKLDFSGASVLSHGKEEDSVTKTASTRRTTTTMRTTTRETHQLQRKVSGIHTVDNAGKKVDKQTAMQNYDPSVSLEIAEKKVFNGKQKQQQQKEKPLLVLHIGPPKTGSTYLQSVLNHLSTKLAEDGYEYAYFWHQTLFQSDCHSSKERNVNCPFSTLFKDLINIHSLKRTNLIISSEFLADVDLTRIKEEVDALSRFNVLVISIYRRLHEMVMSSYHETFKIKSSLYTDEMRQSWPDQNNGMPRIPSFVEDCRNRLFNYTGLGVTEEMKQLWTEEALSHHTLYLGRYRFTREKLEIYGESCPVHIVPIYIKEGKELAPIVVCNFVPKAQATCKEIENGIPDNWSLSTNPSVSLDYDRLAVAAYERGYLQGGGGDAKDKMTSTKQQNQHASYNRSKVSEKIRMYIENTKNGTLHDLPQECLSDTEIEMLYSSSWENEQFMLGTFPTRMLEKYGGGSLDHSNTSKDSNNNEFSADLTRTFLRQQQWALSQYAPMNDAEFRQVFDTYRAGNTFCSVDVEKVLDDPEWIQFFQSHL